MDNALDPSTDVVSQKRPRDDTCLGRLEQASRHFAPPPLLSVVQRAARDKMLEEYPGAELQVRPWPTQLLKHECAQTAAQGWNRVEFDDDIAISAVELSDEDGWVKTERIGASLAKVMAKMRQSSSDGGSLAVLTECARCIDACYFKLTLEE